MAEHVDIWIEPASDRFDAHDERWLGQAAAFRRELEDAVEGVQTVAVQQPGSKGALDSLILSLTSAGAMTAAAEFFKAWIGRAPPIAGSRWPSARAATSRSSSSPGPSSTTARCAASPTR